MTDFDTPRLDTPASDLSAFDAALADAVAREGGLDTPDSHTSQTWESAHPALWRLISLTAVVATAIIVIFAVLDARRAGDVGAEERAGSLDLDSATVTIGALGGVEPARVVALGLDPQEHSGAVASGTAQVRVPSGKPTVIGALDEAGDLIGLALVANSADRAAVEISTDSTARALLSLTPALLQPDMAVLSAQLEVIVADQAYANLVAALDADPNLAAGNVAVETALAEILDRIPARTPFADQGCDSVADPRAYAAAGTCVEPDSGGVVITNEQDRWALAFAVEDGRLCGVVGPGESRHGQIELTTADCGEQAVLAAPGPIVDRALSEQTIVGHVRSAAAVQLFATYVLPFADLAGGAAPVVDDPADRVVGEAAHIVQSLDALAGDNAAFVASIDSLINASSPIARHNGGIAAARAILAEGEAGAIEGAAPLHAAHLDLLGFLDRVGDRMIDASVTWRWTADSSGQIATAGLDS